MKSPKIFGFLLLITVLTVISLFFVLTYREEKGYASLAAAAKINEPDSDLGDKAGQMIMVGFRGIEITSDSAVAKIIREVRPGGVILFDYDTETKSFSRNIVNAEQTKKLISDIQGYSQIPLFVAVDGEGGYINRLKEQYGFTQIESPEKMGKLLPEETKEKVLKLAAELKEAGFNLDLAPVVDVNVNQSNPVIGKLERSFSSDYNVVVAHAKAFIEAMHENGIITSAKHFPGHGSSEQDSHLGLVDVTDSYEYDNELMPFAQLQMFGLMDTVTTAHVINKNIDPNYPVTLSKNFLQNLLRGQIGFKGLIISDDMQMGAIANQYGLKEAIVMAINAGCDVVDIPNNSLSGYDENLAYEVKNIILDAVKNGEIPKERIEESYNRIINLKKEFKIIN